MVNQQNSHNEELLNGSIGPVDYMFRSIMNQFFPGADLTSSESADKKRVAYAAAGSMYNTFIGILRMDPNALSMATEAIRKDLQDYADQQDPLKRN